MTEEKFNRYFSIFVLAGMSVCVVLSTIGKLQENGARQFLLILAAFGALMGVASTVLAANGSIWNFLFGLLDVSIYAYMLYDSKMPAQFLLHVLYILPMEFVGFFQWKSRGASGKKKVRTQVIKGRKWLYYGVFFACVFAGTLALSYFSLGQVGQEGRTFKVILDALVTTANIVALVLMAFAYVEQWYLWIMVNISSIVLWSITLASDPDAGYAVIGIVKYSFYLINAVNGVRVWRKLSRHKEEGDSCNC